MAKQDALLRFNSYQKPVPSGCIEWTGTRMNRGYGFFWYEGQNRLAHRWAWMIERGQITDDLTIDHLCCNKLCVNVAHMELCSRAENSRRGVARNPSWRMRLAERELAKTHCPKGHPYDEHNTYRRPSNPNNRVCKACKRDQGVAERARKKEAS